MNLSERPVCVGDKFEIEIAEIIETEKGDMYRVKGFNSLLLDDYAIGKLKLTRMANPHTDDECEDDLPFTKSRTLPEPRMGGRILIDRDNKDYSHGCVYDLVNILAMNDYSVTIEKDESYWFVRYEL